MYKFLFYFLLFSILMTAQTDKTNTVKRCFYKDSVVSLEIWIGKDKKLDSLKTYYPSAKPNEVFYYDEKGLKNSTCYQLNDEGEKLVTWNFLHGKLISRTDHKLPFNKVNEEKVKKNLQYLTELNQRTNYNPTSINDLYKRGSLRAGLGNTTLALEDLKRVEWMMNKSENNTSIVVLESAKASREKFKSNLYDLFAELYGSLEMENYSFQYYSKAMEAAPKDNRILYNFCNYLQRKKINELALYYLKRIIAEQPEHGYARWGLARLYTDMGEYEKAMENINNAYGKEKDIIARSKHYGGRDLRTTRGLLNHKLGDSEKGIQDLKEALEMDKNNSYAMKNLGIIYLDQQKFNEACELFEKARELKYTLVFDENDLDALIESACNKVALKETIAIPKPFIFPNPATTSITIENYDFKNFEFEFFNFESNSILKGKSSNTTIDVTSLISGFYILKIYNTASPQTFKIIKE